MEGPENPSKESDMRQAINAKPFTQIMTDAGPFEPD